MIQLSGDEQTVKKSQIDKPISQKLHEARIQGYNDATTIVREHILSAAVTLQTKIRKDALKNTTKPKTLRFSKNRDIAEHYQNEVARRARIMGQIILYYKLIVSAHGKHQGLKALKELSDEIEVVIEEVGIEYEHGDSLLLYLTTQILILES